METIVDEDDVQPALADVRTALQSLGIEPEDLTRQRYTEAVIARRARLG
ncbi:hypothetical protein [Streptomyces sp. NPDC088725]